MAKRKRHYWLVKSEPEAFSFQDLMAMEDQTDGWDGVRNYQARNTMRDDMKRGDRVLFYHSNCKPPHVAGIAEVARESHPDPTAFDPGSKYFDPKSKADRPTWFMVAVRGLRELPEPVSLPAIKANRKLARMTLVQKGMRLSVQPVTPKQYAEILAMAGIEDPT